MIEIHKQHYFQPRFAHHIACNPAFKSLSYKGKQAYTNHFPHKQQITHSKSHPLIQSKVYGSILCVTQQYPSETLYALVQGRYTQKWSFPKGHSHTTEMPLECALRELAEETGFTSPPDPTKYIKLSYGYYYLFDLQDIIPLVPRDSHEIMDTKWVTLEEMKEMDVNADVNEFLRTF